MSILIEENLLTVYEARLINVIDGDTVDMVVNLGMGVEHKARIRLASIDAPEMFGVKKEKPEYAEGLKARIQVVIWFEGGTGLYYLSCEHKGIYGRWLGEIWRGVGEISLNDWLIENYYKSQYWERHSQEVLLKKWVIEDDWKRWAQYDFARYGARKYSNKIIGHYGGSRYGIGIYKNMYTVARKGIYNVSRYNSSRYRV